MLKFKTTFPRAMTAIAAYPFGIQAGLPLDVIKKATKCLRRIREAKEELQEALKAKSASLDAEKKAAGEDETLVKTYEEKNAAFVKEVEQANKEPFWVESTKENLDAMKNVLEKIDWTSPDMKSKDKEGKVSFVFSGNDVLNVDEIIEDMENAQEA